MNRRSQRPNRDHNPLQAFACLVGLAAAAHAFAQAAPAGTPPPPANTQPLPTQPIPNQPTPSTPALVTGPATAPTGTALTLQDVIRLAQTNEPVFAAVAANAKITALDRKIALSALLPQALYHNQFLYTQPNNARISANASANNAAVTSSPKFIANNSVHEYVSLGQLTETIGAQQLNAVSRATAANAVAQAELEIARRGLVGTVAGFYYNVSAADRKLAVLTRAADEAASFTTQTQQREAAREVAHADVVKAQLQQQGRQRDLQDAQLQTARTRLELGVLLYPDPRTPFSLATGVADMTAPPPVPTRADVEASAATNPELRSALSAVRGADLGVVAARAAYLPDLALAFNYGIDAPRFEANSTEAATATSPAIQTRNLGYSASAIIDVPIFDWFATHNRVKQSLIARDLARTTLSATQRRLIAQLEEFYAEATVARQQLESLGLSVDTAAESLKLTRLRYTAGEATVLEVVDAQNALTLAETARVDGAIRYEAALANLQILTGTI